MTTTAGDIAARPARRSVSGLVVVAGTAAVALTLPVFLLLDLPLGAWALGTGLVLANAIGHAVVAWLVRDAEPAVILGALGFSMIGRAIGTALVLFLVGARVGASGDAAVGFNRPDLALPAIIVFLLGYTVDAGIEAVRRAAGHGTATGGITA